MIASNARTVPDIRTVIGADTPLYPAAKGELAGPCPKCGGTDRFRVSLKRNLCVCSKCHNRNDHWLTVADYVMWRDGLTYPEAKAKLDGATFQLPPPLRPAPPEVSKQRGPIIKTYDYTDEAGTLLYQACRHDPKTFTLRRPCVDAPDGWMRSIDGTRRVLYRLPELLARPKATVFLVEGEKDADTVAGMGLLATTNAMGSGNWCPAYSEQLRLRHLVLLPDKDKAGAEHVQALNAALKDVAASIIVLTLPGEGKDVSDWAAAGGTREQLEALVVASRAARAPIFPGEIGADELALMIFPPPVAYVPGILYEGATLYAAPPKSGKSVSTLGMCVAIASGGAVFGQIKVPKHRVLYFALEDPIELVQERLFKMMQGRPFPPLLRIFQAAPSLSDMHDAIERHVERFPDTGVVVIDTLAHARGATPRANKDIVQQDYQELIGFSHLAHKLHIAIVIITHTAKAQYDDELAQVSGTFGLSGAVDAIMILARKRHSPEATLAIFSRRLGSEKKYELHWEEPMLSYVLDGEMTPEKAARTTSTAIIDCLQGAGAPLSIRAVSELCQVSYEVAKQRLWQLLKGGEIFKTEDGKYSIQQNPRNRRNFVTAPEENTVTVGYGDGDEDDPPDDDTPFTKLDASVTARNHPHQSNGYEVTTVTPLFKCRACGHRARSPAPWNPDAFTCSKCGVSEEEIPF